MKHKLRILLKDGFIFRFCQFFVLLLSGYIIILVLKWNSLPPELPLFYSQPKGIEQLGSSFQILFLPLFSLILFISHFFLAAQLIENEILAARLLIATATIVSLVFFLTFIKIVFLIA